MAKTPHSSRKGYVARFQGSFWEDHVNAVVGVAAGDCQLRMSKENCHHGDSSSGRLRSTIQPTPTPVRQAFAYVTAVCTGARQALEQVNGNSNSNSNINSNSAQTNSKHDTNTTGLIGSCHVPRSAARSTCASGRRRRRRKRRMSHLQRVATPGLELHMVAVTPSPPGPPHTDASTPPPPPTGATTMEAHCVNRKRRAPSSQPRVWGRPSIGTGEETGLTSSVTRRPSKLANRRATPAATASPGQ